MQKKMNTDDNVEVVDIELFEMMKANEKLGRDLFLKKNLSGCFEETAEDKVENKRAERGSEENQEENSIDQNS